MHKDFSDDAWADYTYWVLQDKKTLKKINQLLADIERNGNDGSANDKFGTVTVRFRDSMAQERVKIEDLHTFLTAAIKNYKPVER